jgi:hypothetical protein
MSPDWAPVGFPKVDKRYRTMRASKTKWTSVPTLPFHVIALELKYLQIIAKMAHRDDPLHV